MNPCAKNKRLIAWMAAGVPDEADTEVLRRHMENCPGCRSYWKSMRELSDGLINVSAMPPADPSEDFHATFVQRITTEEQPRTFVEWFTPVRRFWRERPLTAISAGAALVLGLLLWIQSASRNEHRVPVGAQTEVVSKPAPRAVPSASLASYRRAAEISDQSLDELLNEQITRTSPASQKFTVSSLLTSSSEY